MKRVFFLAAALSFTSLFIFAELAEAGERYRRSQSGLSEHPQSRTYRRSRPQVRGYRRRVGGYSYYFEDSLANDFALPRQGEPFDSGFFFDSNSISPLGNAPYLY